MIRILHLTDFHLNKTTLRDWNNYLKDALISTLKHENSITPIDIVAFTGDMIDMGGKDLEGATKAFNIFHENIIQSILQTTNLPIEKFLIVPGNHDIVREADSERIELGNTEWFKKSNRNISSYIEENIEGDSFSGMERIREYKDFEKELYSKISDYNYSHFGSSVKFKIGKENVGISCLNSAWRCYGKDDNGNIIIGDEQLIRNFKTISNCSVKIALVHHPLDWVSQIERGLISNHIYKDYDLLLLGHVHENQTSISSGFTGSLFINIAPSGLNDIESDSRKYSNGFTLIDFDKNGKQVRCKYFRYNHDKKEFVLNTDLGDAGEFNYAFPSPITKQKDDILQKVLNNIKQDHCPHFSKHLIGKEGDVNMIDIKDGYVIPPITQGNFSSSPNEEIQIGIIDIVKSNAHQLFFGGQESGRTMLLFRIIKEYLDEYTYLRKIPVYIDLYEIGNKEITTCIKEYLRCNTEEANYLIDNNHLVLLCDNLNFNDKILELEIKKINSFAEKHEGIQIIATAENNFTNVTPIEYLEKSKIGFKYFFIHYYRTKQIKSLMRFWVPEENDIKYNERIERMVESFNSFALPSTAMSVSLFLWSTEYEDRKPINQAVLLDIYIEIILQKLSKNNIYRDRFDYLNKCQLLAKVAQEMIIADQPNYSILYSDLLRIVEDYIKNSVAFDFEAKAIVDYFFEHKIFVKYQSNRVKFRYSCFLHFFTAKRMEYNSDFKEYILDENNYYKHVRAIDYYTGNVRSDEALLKLIYERFESMFNPVNDLIEQHSINLDEHFTDFLDDKHQSQTEKINIDQIKKDRPTEETFEKIHNQQLSKIPDPSKILKQDSGNNLELMLVLMSNVLRNSEGVENKALKKQVYSAIVKFSLDWTILYREYLIFFYIKYKKLPAQFNKLNFEYVLKFAPFHTQAGMKKHLGTQKLAPIILEKIKADEQNRSITNMEAYMSVALYSDIQGRDYPKYLKNLIKGLKNNIVRDYTYVKLINYYYKRTRPGSPNELTYIDLLAELKIRSQKGVKRMKESIIKAIEDGKRKYLSSNSGE